MRVCRQLDHLCVLLYPFPLQLTFVSRILVSDVLDLRIQTPVFGLVKGGHLRPTFSLFFYSACLLLTVLVTKPAVPSLVFGPVVFFVSRSPFSFVFSRPFYALPSLTAPCLAAASSLVATVSAPSATTFALRRSGFSCAFSVPRDRGLLLLLKLRI